MVDWTKANDEELREFLDEIDIKNMRSWLLRFSPAELPHHNGDVTRFIQSHQGK
ncbi:hypothetical protein [Bacillus sp. HMF5848]|uniref:hypothetical protein n=1 Tax=Bacillus sp. HMF5848 TaxID=2495421 RepID=UPI001639F90C|nr:hypothetical protein [Bacillus sp. HMF5848]